MSGQRFRSGPPSTGLHAALRRPPISTPPERAQANELTRTSFPMQTQRQGPGATCALDALPLALPHAAGDVDRAGQGRGPDLPEHRQRHSDGGRRREHAGVGRCQRRPRLRSCLAGEVCQRRPSRKPHSMQTREYVLCGPLRAICGLHRCAIVVSSDAADPAATSSARARLRCAVSASARFAAPSWRRRRTTPDRDRKRGGGRHYATC